MAATASQGKTFTLFMVGLTSAAAGVAFFSTGIAKVALVAGLILLAVSFAGFIKIKPEEGKVAEGIQPLGLRLIGVAVALLGWVVVLFGIHLTASVSGRLVTTLIGFAISLVGVLYFLPTAANKNAIWKG
ncbi:MAG TPA: hypothetical protein VMV98_08740 [Acidobacteriaceae bacterium]|nr:hypothetical protein [Acidobacteriaceae bacterium]